MITGKQRSELKRLAQELKPAVMIGKEEVTPAVISAIEDYLAAHELIKVQNAALSLEKVRETLEAALGQEMPHRQVLCGSLHLCGEALAIREARQYRSSQY